MSKYILKYSRDERVKYISHLDFIRMFHRAVRRSGVNFLFSEGFNPHPIMTVAMPLSVGVTADAEYMKVGFTDEFSEEEIKGKINDALPAGFKICAVHRLQGKEIDLSKIRKAKYTVIAELQEGSAGCDAGLLMNEKSIVVMKRTKSGEKPSDIRPHIFSLDSKPYGENALLINMTVSCSNDYNLKPETVISAMENFFDGFQTSFLCIHRNELIFS